MKNFVLASLVWGATFLCVGFAPAQTPVHRGEQKNVATIDVAGLPVCTFQASTILMGSVIDINFAGAQGPQGDPLNFGVITSQQKIRPIASGESIRILGNVWDSSGKAQYLVVVNGQKTVTTYEGMNKTNPGELFAPGELDFVAPSGLLPDRDGNVELGIIASDGSCRGPNSPVKVPLASVVDGVNGFPVDADHPAVSGYLRVIGTPATQLAVSVGGNSLPAYTVGLDAIVPLPAATNGPAVTVVRKTDNALLLPLGSQ